MMVDRICAYCGGPFKAKSSDVKRGWANCCCKSHAAKNREKGGANYLPARRAAASVIAAILAVVLTPADFTSVHQTLDDTTTGLIEHCQAVPSSCSGMAGADMALVHQLERVTNDQQE